MGSLVLITIQLIAWLCVLSQAAPAVAFARMLIDAKQLLQD